jgi:putative hydrolase of the HAD superfamily
VRAVLLDLDDTIVPDYADFKAAVDDVAAALGAPAGMAAALHACARRRWGEAPDTAVLQMRDISSWEALWAPFPVDDREWAARFRLAAWREALADHGVEDSDLTRRLAASYREHRLARCRPYPDTVATLEALRGRVRLAVVTNGMEDHQRSKLDAAGLTEMFDAVVTSGAVGVSKPDPHIFHAALERLGCRPADAVMVGDHPLRDVAGAQQAGLRGVWIDRDGGDDRGVVPDARITELGELTALGWW